MPKPYYRFLDEIRFVEPDVFRIISHLVQPGWICADVGAHCGTVTALLARCCSPKGKVYAFEPIRSNYRLLQNRVAEFGDQVKIQPAAVGATPGTLVLYAGPHSTTWTFIKPDQEAEKVEAAVITLDETFAEIPLNFIKIDVEGAETLVLEGSKTILSKYRPAILVEFHNRAAWAGAHQLWDCGYRLYDLDGQELPPRSEPANAYCHCLALPE